MVIATVPVRPRSPAPWDRSGISPFLYRGVEQLVACRAHNPEVVGSSPSPATKQASDRNDQGLFLLKFQCLRKL